VKADNCRFVCLVPLVLSLLSVLWTVAPAAAYFGPDDFGWRQYASSNAVDATRILFIGNSLTCANHAPSYLAWMLSQSFGKGRFDIESYTAPGATLADHQKSDEVRELLAKHWDYIILQDQSSVPIEGQKSLARGFRQFLPLTAPTKAKIIAIMTWANRGYFSDQCIISQAYRRTARQLKIPLVPVGDIFFYIQENNPSLELYSHDGHHAGVNGAYLYALAVYEQLFPARKLLRADSRRADAPLDFSVARKLGRCLSDFRANARKLPEYSLESPDANTDIAYYWATSGRAARAEVIYRQRLDAIKKLFPVGDQTAYALKKLADCQKLEKTGAKISEAWKNYAAARDIYRRVEGAKSRNAAEITKIMKEMKQLQKREK
jgi:hypothetical protein